MCVRSPRSFLGPLGHSLAAASAVVGLPAFAAALALRPAWRAGWRQRLGDVAGRASGGLWVHAASLGETRAAAPLLAALGARGEPVRLTHTRAAALEVLGDEPWAGQLVGRSLAPLDHPWALGRALDRATPRAIVLVESELWPFAIREATRRGIPVGVVSASISRRSRRRHAALGRLTRGVFASLAFVAARSDDDAAAFHRLGTPRERIATTGDLKLAAARAAPPLPEAISRTLAGRLLVVGGCTHRGEEGVLARAVRALCGEGLPASLILAPRRIDRVGEVAGELRGLGLQTRLRSAWGASPLADGEVGLLDRTGELPSWYAAATVAFVGGTLVPIGGHNPYEPARAGAFVIVGPHTGEVEQAVERICALGGCERVAGIDGLGAALARRITAAGDSRARGGATGDALCDGADVVDRTIAWVDRAAPPGGGA